jgi:hypothetical protein
LRYLEGLAPALEGERNHKCFAVANRLKDFGVPEEDCGALMADHWRCDPPLDDVELLTAVGSAYRAKQTQLGSAAPEVEFAAPVERGSTMRKLIDFCCVPE